jgi:hypothetical protein
MKRTKQHSKTFVFVSLLGLALVLGLIHKGVAGRLDELPTSAYRNGYTVDGIRYNVSVSSLRYDSSTQEASSFHLIFLENHSDFVITSRYLYAQHVYQDNQETRVRSNVTTWLTGPRVEPIEDTPPPEDVNTRDDTLTNNVGGLPPGYHWINAYTELEFNREGSNIKLLTPRAEAAKRFRKVGD